MGKLKYFTLAIAVLLGSPSFAQRFDLTADVGAIRYHEASNTLAPHWQNDSWFAIKNITGGTPDCAKYGNEFIISIPEGNDDAFALVLAAKMSGAKVGVTIDDSVKFPSEVHCRLQYITVL